MNDNCEKDSKQEHHHNHKHHNGNGRYESSKSSPNKEMRESKWQRAAKASHHGRRRADLDV